MPKRSKTGSKSSSKSSKSSKGSSKSSKKASTRTKKQVRFRTGNNSSKKKSKAKQLSKEEKEQKRKEKEEAKLAEMMAMQALIEAENQEFKPQILENYQANPSLDIFAAHMVKNESYLKNLYTLLCDPNGELDESTALEKPDDIWANITENEAFEDLTDFQGLGISDIDKLNNEVQIDMDAWEIDEDALIAFFADFNKNIGDPYLDAYQANSLPFDPIPPKVYIRRKRNKSQAHFGDSLLYAMDGSDDEKLGHLEDDLNLSDELDLDKMDVDNNLDANIDNGLDIVEDNDPSAIDLDTSPQDDGTGGDDGAITTDTHDTGTPMSANAIDFDEEDIDIDESGVGGAFGGLTLDTGRTIPHPKRPSLEHNLSDVSLGSSGDLKGSSSTPTSSSGVGGGSGSSTNDLGSSDNNMFDVGSGSDDEEDGGDGKDNEIGSEEEVDEEDKDEIDLTTPQADDEDGKKPSLMAGDDMIEWFYRLCDVTGENRPLLWKTLYYHNLDETQRQIPHEFNEKEHKMFKKGELNVRIDYETKENDGIFNPNDEYLTVIDRKRDYMEHIYKCQIPGMLKTKSEHGENHLKIFECGEGSRLPSNLETEGSFKHPVFIHNFTNLKKYGQQMGWSYGDSAEESRYEELSSEEERWYVFRLRFWRKLKPGDKDDSQCSDALQGQPDIYQKEGSFTIKSLEKQFKQNYNKLTSSVDGKEQRTTKDKQGYPKYYKNSWYGSNDLRGYKCVEDRLCIQNSHCCEKRATKFWWSGLFDAPPREADLDDRLRDLVGSMGHFFDRDGLNISDELELEFKPITFCGELNDDYDRDSLVGYPNIANIDLNSDGVCQIGDAFRFGQTLEVTTDDRKMFDYDIVSLDVLVPPVLNLACNNIRDVMDLSDYYVNCFNISNKSRKGKKGGKGKKGKKGKKGSDSSSDSDSSDESDSDSDSEDEEEDNDGVTRYSVSRSLVTWDHFKESPNIFVTYNMFGGGGGNIGRRRMKFTLDNSNIIPMIKDKISNDDSSGGNKRGGSKKKKKENPQDRFRACSVQSGGIFFDNHKYRALRNHTEPPNIGLIKFPTLGELYKQDPKDEWTLCFGFTNYRSHSEDSMILFKDKLIEIGIKTEYTNDEMNKYKIEEFTKDILFCYVRRRAGGNARIKIFEECIEDRIVSMSDWEYNSANPSAMGEDLVVGAWCVRSHIVMIDKSQDGIFRAYLDGRKVYDGKLSENGKELGKLNTQMFVESVYQKAPFLLAHKSDDHGLFHGFVYDFNLFPYRASEYELNTLYRGLRVSRNRHMKQLWTNTLKIWENEALALAQGTRALWDGMSKVVEFIRNKRKLVDRNIEAGEYEDVSDGGGSDEDGSVIVGDGDGGDDEEEDGSDSEEEEEDDSEEDSDDGGSDDEEEEEDSDSDGDGDSDEDEEEEDSDSD